MKRIGVVGAKGTMGQRVMALLEVRGYEIIAIDPMDATVPSRLKDAPMVDVVIDFSHPANCEALLEDAARLNTPLVIATTGFSEAQQAAIEKTANHLAIFQSANMAFGVHVLRRIISQYAAVLSDYDIEIIEQHHRYKQDAPSGTATMLAQTINETLPSPRTLTSQRAGKRSDDTIGMSVVRAGNIVGKHDVMFASSGDSITISHEALSKDLFAEGALKAAKFITQKTSGLFGMDQLIEESGQTYEQ